MKKIIKWGLIIFVALPIVGLIIIGTIGNMMGAKGNSNQAGNPVVTPTVTPKATPTSTPTVTQQAQKPVKKVIKYEVLQTWSINNGGYGKAILISIDYLNEADMTTLGQKLNADTKNDKNDFISVYTDKEAWKLKDKLSDDLSQSEEAFYDSHYVGQYNKNANSGLHAFAIYFDGVSGKNSKIINY